MVGGGSGTIGEEEGHGMLREEFAGAREWRKKSPGTLRFRGLG
jgi:hypothetical protein